ncbi:MAG TPA: hypothetical protein V6D12_06165 [Candidatus Obscuribacterales bacterium]
MSKTTKKLLKLLLLGLIVFICIVSFPQLQAWLSGAYKILGRTWQVIINILTIGAIAIFFAAFLSPLEALGWWAGWYGDEIDTNIDPGTLAEPIPLQTKVTRYVIYLDGIAQAESQYFPDVEEFLSQLAAVLPDDILIIKGLMSYSAINRPLTKDRLLSFFWRLADELQTSKSTGILGALIGATINIRNTLIVAVSADQRYGPIYNQGTAQVMYNSLITYGYQPNSGVPITLIGYSGGGQIAMGAAPYLKRALAAPIEVISISGVLSGNINALELEHLYHLVGDKDPVEREGPIFFPKRWKILFLSYWNRAKRRGKISLISLGPVGHNAAGGPFDANKFLPDGRSFLQQTVELVTLIIQGKLALEEAPVRSKPSNYDRYIQAAFNQPSYYPLEQTVNLELYRAIAPWMGRLILPKQEQRSQVQGVLFEVHHAAAEYQHLVGKIVNLRWSDEPRVQAYLRKVTKNLHFSTEAKYSKSQGCIHPDRLNTWQLVDPLESLAGARPNDDVIVKLRDPIEVQESEGNERPNLIISREPIQITGRFYGLVKILQPVNTDEAQLDRFRVVHFNRASRQFDGVEEIVCIPQVIADTNGIFSSTNRDIEKSLVNENGWYIYGAPDKLGVFVVQAIAPRALLRLQPDEVIFGKKPAINYLKNQAWEVKGQKGKTSSVLLCPQGKEIQEAIQEWQEGDRALLIHVYGGIGGKKREPATKTPIFFGHFAYGMAQVVREPLADELSFDIEYYQVYTHNIDGIIAGATAWCHFMGDRQWGWLGTRPVSDILIKLDAVTKDFDINGLKRAPLGTLVYFLQMMMARYRIGDGTGGTYVSPANNCVQDANQALYAAIKAIEKAIADNPNYLKWLTDTPDEAQRFEKLVKLGKSLKRKLLPFGSARADWENNAAMLGISLEDHPIETLLRGLASWRTLLPRLASDTITQLFLQQGASVWVLRTNQVGGIDTDIEPIAPTKIGF